MNGRSFPQLIVSATNSMTDSPLLSTLLFQYRFAGCFVCLWPISMTLNAESSESLFSHISREWKYNKSSASLNRAAANASFTINAKASTENWHMSLHKILLTNPLTTAPKKLAQDSLELHTTYSVRAKNPEGTTKTVVRLPQKLTSVETQTIRGKIKLAFSPIKL